MYRVVVACLGAFLLSACMARDPIMVTGADGITSKLWRIERQLDRITNAPLSSAYVTGRSSNSFDDFPRPAQLQISCFKGQPLVRFGFDFRVGSTQNASFAYRFDDKSGHETDARFLYQAKSVVLEDKAVVTQFLSELVSSNSLFVRIRALNAGRTAAEFQVDGARAAVDAALGECLAKPERSRTRANS